MKHPGCELCETQGGQLLLSNEWLRVVLVDDADFPGFTRVIWNDHVREMTDLAADSQQRLLQTVLAVERAQRAVLAPVKVNLASLGNVTPHLHWHVIPRFADDSHFPQPVWGERQRTTSVHAAADRRGRLDRLRWRIAEEVARVPRR
jgi:diadenosine tetraphosphate (Ap4A) HIT family hydrolase